MSQKTSVGSNMEWCSKKHYLELMPAFLRTHHCEIPVLSVTENISRLKWEGDVPRNITWKRCQCFWEHVAAKLLCWCHRKCQWVEIWSQCSKKCYLKTMLVFPITRRCKNMCTECHGKHQWIKIHGECSKEHYLESLSVFPRMCCYEAPAANVTKNISGLRCECMALINITSKPC